MSISSKHISRLFSFALVSLLAGSVTLLAATPTSPNGFHIGARWNIGGRGGWSFLAVDSAAHRLFIPRTDHISVVDTGSGKVVGEIPGMSNLRGIALDDAGKYGYATDVTDGTAGFVRVFDRTKLNLTASIPVGPVPFAIVFDPATKLVFAFSSRAHNVAVIDTSTNRVVSTVALAGRPGYATGDGKGGVFVALPAQGEIQRIDAATRNVTASWPLAPCSGPGGVAIDMLAHRIFTTCEDHKLISLNTVSGEVEVIGGAPQNAGDVGFDPRLNLLFVADPAGSLALFRKVTQHHYTRLQSVVTESGARTMVVDHEHGKAYLVTSRYGMNTGNVSEELRYRPTPVPGTFSVLVVSR